MKIYLNDHTYLNFVNILFIFQRKFMFQYINNKIFPLILQIISYTNTLQMFAFSKKQSSLQKNIRDRYCPLIFQKILRNYQKPQQITIKPKLMIKQKDINKQNQESKHILVDLSKKVKIKRYINEDNKQNIQDNGSTQYQVSTSSVNKKQEINLRLNDLELQIQMEPGLFHVNQFMQDQQNGQGLQQKLYIGQNEQQFLQNDICSPKVINDANYQIEYKTLNQERTDQQQNSKQQRNQEMNQVLIQNLQAITSCQTNKNHQNSYKNLDFNNQANKLQIQNKDKPTNTHHIKNKISLRILKKKLQSLSPQQVVQDLIKHRKIQLDGLSKPEKNAVCQALLSFVKSQLIE